MNKRKNNDVQGTFCMLLTFRKINLITSVTDFVVTESITQSF